MSFNMPCRQIEALSPLAQRACRMFLDECKKQGINNVLVTQTLRTAEYQNQLYQQGRTKPGKVVTNLDGYKKKSVHQNAMAWDICKNVKGQEYSDKEFFRKCGKIAKTLGITWGGTWTSFIDEPHFEITTKWVAPQKELTTIQTTKITIVLNGIERQVETINKGGFNFVKLRDLADDRIKIGYVDNKPTVSVEG